MAVLAACGGSDDVDGTDGLAVEGAGGQGGSKPPVATVWGDLTLAEEVPADDERLLPPDGARVVAAWAGTERFWCLGNPDSEADVLVGLLDDGRLLKTFETDVVVSVALRAA